VNQPERRPSLRNASTPWGSESPVSDLYVTAGRGGYIPCVTGIGMTADLTCPSCGESVLDMGKYTVGQRDVRFERATCPQCRAELVRHPDLEDKTWKVHRSRPRPDEELGGSG
jgi:ribosomal protein S27AE